MITKKELNVGLVKGRHPMPVDEYIINGDVHALDFAGIKNAVEDFFVRRHPNIKEINVYLTGLTSVTIEVMKICVHNGITVNFYHYDRDHDSYICQSGTGDLFHPCAFCGQAFPSNGYHCPNCGAS